MMLMKSHWHYLLFRTHFIWMLLLYLYMIPKHPKKVQISSIKGKQPQKGKWQQRGILKRTHANKWIMNNIHKNSYLWHDVLTRSVSNAMFILHCFGTSIRWYVTCQKPIIIPMYLIFIFLLNGTDCVASPALIELNYIISLYNNIGESCLWSIWASNYWRFKSWGFKPIPVPFRHFLPFGK